MKDKEKRKDLTALQIQCPLQNNQIKKTRQSIGPLNTVCKENYFQM